MAKYCANCGKELTDEQDICLNCGVRVKKSTTSSDPNAKSKLAAGLLGIFLGGLGIHNFYLGYTGKAIAQIALSICFGAGAIWGLIEGIMILSSNDYKDADGNTLRD